MNPEGYPYYDWCKYLQQRVSKTGSCNHYMERPNSSNSGYSDGNSGGGCFLTSACVEYLGKQDDCEELNVLRQFRDRYMKELENGETLIKEYYAIAPKIVEMIKASPNKDNYFQYIYETINKCVSYIKCLDNDSALNEYINMVGYFKTEFSIK